MVHNVNNDLGTQKKITSVSSIGCFTKRFEDSPVLYSLFLGGGAGGSHGPFHMLFSPFVLFLFKEGCIPGTYVSEDSLIHHFILPVLP